MKVITFNVKTDGNKIFSNYYKRLKGFIELIKQENPDIIGTQELTYKAKNKLIKLFKNNKLNYIIYGESRNRSTKSNDEYNAILVKSNIKVLNTKTYSLSDTPLEPLTRFENDSYPRILTLVETNHYYIYNSHLEHITHSNKLLQLDCISKLLKKDKPIIIMGDFNLEAKELKKFCQKNKLINTTENIDYTYFFKNNKKHIDHILISKSIKYTNPIKHPIKYKNVFISDHYPISIEID